MEILKDFVMPINVSTRGKKESMYLTDAQWSVISKLRNGEAVILPHLEEAKRPQHIITRRLISRALGREDGAKVPEYEVGLLPDKRGVAVKRVMDNPDAPTEEPTADAAPEEPTADAAE